MKKDGTRWHDEYGREHMDTDPLVVSAGGPGTVTEMDRIKQLLESHSFNQALAARGEETIDEANDFDVPDDDEFEDLAVLSEHQFNWTDMHDIEPEPQEIEIDNSAPPPLA